MLLSSSETIDFAFAMKTTIFCTLAKMIRNVENKQMSSSHTFYQLD